MPGPTLSRAKVGLSRKGTEKHIYFELFKKNFRHRRFGHRAGHSQILELFYKTDSNGISKLFRFYFRRCEREFEEMVKRLRSDRLSKKIQNYAFLGGANIIKKL